MEEDLRDKVRDFEPPPRLSKERFTSYLNIVRQPKHASALRSVPTTVFYAVQRTIWSVRQEPHPRRTVPGYEVEERRCGGTKLSSALADPSKAAEKPLVEIPESAPPVAVSRTT